MRVSSQSILIASNGADALRPSSRSVRVFEYHPLQFCVFFISAIHNAPRIEQPRKSAKISDSDRETKTISVEHSQDTFSTRNSSQGSVRFLGVIKGKVVPVLLTKYVIKAYCRSGGTDPLTL